MATYSILELWQKWQVGDLIAEQAMGYLLQILPAVVQNRTETEKRLQRIEQHLNIKR